MAQGSKHVILLLALLIKIISALRCHNSFTAMSDEGTMVMAVDVCPAAQSGMKFEPPEICLVLHGTFYLKPSNTSQSQAATINMPAVEVVVIRFGFGVTSQFSDAKEFLELDGKCVSFPAHRFPSQWIMTEMRGSGNILSRGGVGGQVEACGCKADFCNGAQPQGLAYGKGPQQKNGIQMAEFDEDQIIGNNLKLTCWMSQHLVVLPIRFGMSYAKSSDNQEEIAYIRPAHVFTEQRLASDNNIIVTASTVIELDESTLKLERIFCFGGPLRQDHGLQMNVSRPITARVPTAPSIVLGPKVSKSTPPSSSRPDGVGGRDSELYVDLEENSLNETITCEAFGAPLPTIEWTSQNKGFPKPVEIIRGHRDATRVKSRMSWVSFPKIFPTVAGTYDCEAKNYLGTATGHIILSVESARSTKISFGKPTGDEKTADSHGGKEDDGNTTATIIVAIVCPIVAVLVVLAIVVAFLWRHMRIMNLHLRNLTEEEVRDFVYGNSTFDPNNAHAPIEALPFNSSLEIPRHLIDLDKKRILGSGQYGVVMEGYIRQERLESGGDQKGKGTMAAMKMAKPNVNVDNFKALLSEIKIMAYLGQHKHIACLLGACTSNIRQREVLAAVEFCGKGDLQNFLRKRRQSFQNLFELSNPPPPHADKNSLKQGTTNVYQNEPEGRASEYENSENLSTFHLLQFAHGVASGMEFLTTKNVIHGDLAARNVLLTDDLVAKVSDFGLSRRLVQCTNYVKKSRQIPLPFKWLSLEALRDLNFSIKSDVWSYGITLWEIFSLSETPYPGYNWDEGFLSKLEAGYRMKRPDFATDQVYTIMLACWEKKAEARPNFFEVRCQLEEILCLLSDQQNSTAK